MTRTGNQKFEYLMKYTQIYMVRGKQERERDIGRTGKRDRREVVKCPNLQ